jgi:hypothetical protein
MAFSTVFHIPKPDYRVLRYDLELNSSIDIIEAALLGFPSADPPGSASNFPDVVPTNGMRWTDTANNQMRVYYNGTWQMVYQFI